MLTICDNRTYHCNHKRFKTNRNSTALSSSILWRKQELVRVRQRSWKQYQKGSLTIAWSTLHVSKEPLSLRPRKIDSKFYASVTSQHPNISIKSKWSNISTRHYMKGQSTINLGPLPEGAQNFRVLKTCIKTSSCAANTGSKPNTIGLTSRHVYTGAGYWFGAQLSSTRKTRRRSSLPSRRFLCSRRWSTG